MFAGELKSIQEAEIKADEMLKQAKAEAKMILQDAKDEAEKIMLAAESEADEIISAHVHKGEGNADEMYKKVIDETRQKCSEIREKAAGGYENATSMISERIVRKSVDS